MISLFFKIGMLGCDFKLKGFVTIGIWLWGTEIQQVVRANHHRTEGQLFERECGCTNDYGCLNCV